MIRNETVQCRHGRGKGPFIKDVRTKEGRGVGLKAGIVREVAWIYYYRSSQNADKGGEGVQNPENFADVLYVWPLMEKQEYEICWTGWTQVVLSFELRV